MRHVQPGAAGERPHQPVLGRPHDLDRVLDGEEGRAGDDRGADADADQDETVGVDAALPGEEVDGRGGQQRADEGRQRQQLARLAGDDPEDGDQTGAAVDADDVGGDERVTHHALEERPRHGQRRADEDGAEDAGQAQRLRHEDLVLRPYAARGRQGVAE